MVTLVKNMSASLPPYKQIIGIDLLRLIAAVLVMLYHYMFWDLLPKTVVVQPSINTALPAHFAFGWCGVEIFFVISGFVIAYSAQRETARAFINSRIARLAPAAWICSSIALLIYLRLGTAPNGTLLKQYGMTFVFWPFGAIDGVYWSLGVEISFYFLVALTISYRRFGVEAIISIVGLASTVFWLFATIARVILRHAGHAADSLLVLLNKIEAARILQLCLVQHGCMFALGVVFFTTARSGLTKRRVALTIVFSVGTLLELFAQNAMIGRLSHTVLSPWPALVVVIVSLASMAIVVRLNDYFANLLGPRGIRIARTIGLLTYPLYLIHPAVGRAISAVTPTWGASSRAVLAIATATSAAALIERYLERSLRRALRHKLTARDHLLNGPVLRSAPAEQPGAE